jgi:hypothetical protein
MTNQTAAGVFWNSVINMCAAGDYPPDVPKVMEAYAAAMSTHLQAEIADLKAAGAVNRLTCLCYWCGVKFSFNRDGTKEEQVAALSSHISSCEKHPVRRMIENLVGAESRVRELEASEDQLIGERDDAEEAISQAYFLIKGESPEWSNLFGYEQALEEIDFAQKALRSRLAQMEAQPNAADVEALCKAAIVASGYINVLQDCLLELQQLGATVHICGTEYSEDELRSAIAKVRGGGK